MIALVGSAIWLTMDPRPIVAQADTPARALTEPPPPFQPDVERSATENPQFSGPVTLKLAPGEKSLWARLTCPFFKSKKPLSNGEASFPEPPPDCKLEIQGARTGYAAVYPGDRLVCGLDADRRVRCTGGVAQKYAGQLTVETLQPAAVFVDGKPVGKAPTQDMTTTVGPHAVRVQYESGFEQNWTIQVDPNERIRMRFPNPPEASTVADAPSATSTLR